MNGTGSPPEAGTRCRAVPEDGESTMTSSRPQLPPLPFRARQIVSGAPPSTGTFLSFPSEREKKAIQRPSGDQNGNCAPWDPGYSVTRPSAIART